MLSHPPPQGIEKFIGKEVVSLDDQRLGTVGRFLPNRVTGVAEWLIADSGLLGFKKLIVPLAGSSFDDDRVHVAYPAMVVTEAPEIEADDELSPEAESILESYFGLGASSAQ